MNTMNMFNNQTPPGRDFPRLEPPGVTILLSWNGTLALGAAKFCKRVVAVLTLDKSAVVERSIVGVDNTELRIPFQLLIFDIR